MANDEPKTLMAINQETKSEIEKLKNHVSDLDKRLSRQEKLLIAAIVTNLPQLIKIVLSLL